MVDICRSIMGDFGRWQALSVVFLFLLKFPAAWYSCCILFTAPTPSLGEIYCLVAPESNDVDIGIAEELTENWLKIPNPALEMGDHEQRMAFCSIAEQSWKRSARHVYGYGAKTFDENGNRVNLNVTVRSEDSEDGDYAKMECLKYDYVDVKDKDKSLNSQFDLVCSRDFLVTLTQCFHNIGLVFGTVIAFFGVKRISPKSLLFSSVFSTVALGLATGLVQIYEFHLVFRCLVSASAIILVHCGAWIFRDICHGRALILVTMCYEFFWSLGLILLPQMSKAFVSWTYLYLSITLPILLYVFFYWFIPDSPRWLIKHNEIDRAVHLLERAASVNKREQYLPLDLEEELKELRTTMETASPPASYRSLFSSNKKYFWLVLNLTWIIWNVCYVGTMLNIRNFGYKFIHYNFTAGAMCEISGLFFSYYIILYSRRVKWLIPGVCGIITGFLCMLTWLLPTKMPPELRSLYYMALCMPMKLVTSCALSVQNTCTAELFNDEQKNTAQFGLILAARCSSTYMVFLGATVRYGVPVVMSCWGTLSIFGGIGFVVISFHPVYTDT